MMYRLLLDMTMGLIQHSLLISLYHNTLIR